VSLYNETNGKAILPTPVIGGVGIIDDARKSVGLTYGEGQTLLLIGGACSHLGQSLFVREIYGAETGGVPPIDLGDEKQTGDAVRKMIHDGLITACHDVSDGGVLVALAEMAIKSNLGAHLNACIDDAGFWFGEDQGRYIVATSAPLNKINVPHIVLGNTGGDDVAGVTVHELRQLNENWLPDYMSGQN